MALSQPQIVTHRTEDYPGLDQASGGELERLLRALNTNTQGAQQAITAIQSNPLLAASYYRLNEGPYPTSSSATCLLLQYRTGNSWATVSAWGKDGRPVTEAWIAATLTNSWVNVGAGYPTAGYYKDATGRVWVGGSVQNGTLAAAVLTFPVGYRPAATRGFPVSCGVAPAYATITAAGVLTINGAAGVPASGVSLDVISFRAEG